MTLPLSIIMHGPPVPKARARKGRGGHWYTPEKTRKYEKQIGWVARVAVLRGDWPRDARYKVTLDVWFPDARRRDHDNVLKSALDACNGVLWNDDSQVTQTTVRHDIDRADPRICMTVEVVC